MATPGENNGVCYIVTLIIALVLAVWGFSDFFRMRQANEASTTDVISRQLRGLGLLMLALVVMGLGATLCLSMAEGGRVIRAYL